MQNRSRKRKQTRIRQKKKEYYSEKFCKKLFKRKEKKKKIILQFNHSDICWVSFFFLSFTVSRKKSPISPFTATSNAVCPAWI